MDLFKYLAHQEEQSGYSADLWSWDKPKAPGFYILCRGDVVTPDNMSAMNILRSPNGELYWEEGARNPSVGYVEDLPSFYQFLLVKE